MTNTLEHQRANLRVGAGVVSRVDRALLRVVGADRLRYLNGMLSNDVSKLSPGEGQMAVKTTNKGRVEGLLRVRARPDAFDLDLAEVSRRRVKDSLERLIVMDDCSIVDRSSLVSVVGFYGPKSLGVLAELGLAVPSIHLGFLTLPKEDLDIDIDADVEAGLEVDVVRDDSLGVEGFEVVLPCHAREALIAKAVKRGAAEASVEALEVFRVEAGVPMDGVDLLEDTIPMEARLEYAISMTKGCYVGQEVIARATNLGGVRHGLVGLVLEGEACPAPLSKILVGQEERETGVLTSSAFSLPRSRVVALGYVRKEDDVQGSTVTVVSPDGKRFYGEVSPLPFPPTT